MKLADITPDKLTKIGFEAHKDFSGFDSFDLLINDNKYVRESISIYFNYAGPKLIPCNISQIGLVREYKNAHSESFKLPYKVYTMRDIKALVKILTS